MLLDEENGLGSNNVEYEKPLLALDGTFYLPDFTIKWRGKTYYWEHLGMLDNLKYKKRWEEKKQWYDKHFPGQLLLTKEGTNLSIYSKQIIKNLKVGN
jgi:exodeoxyribonuclease V alpha subunit